MLEAAGADGVVTMDVHNFQAYQNTFKILAENLEAKNLFVSYLLPIIQNEDAVIMSPDLGGMKRAENFSRQSAKTEERITDCIYREISQWRQG